MQRYLNGKRPFDIYSIAKICVGARLTVQKTEELFKIYGHPLDVDAYRFDAILINAINNKCRIIDFYNTCKEYGFEAMWWEWDRYSN